MEPHDCSAWLQQALALDAGVAWLLQLVRLGVAGCCCIGVWRGQASAEGATRGVAASCNQGRALGQLPATNSPIIRPRATWVPALWFNVERVVCLLVQLLPACFAMHMCLASARQATEELASAGKVACMTCQGAASAQLCDDG